MEISGKSGQVILKDKTLRETVTVKNCKDCTIDGCDFVYDRTDTSNLTLSNCQRCKVINSKFHDKSTKGLFLRIIGADTKDNIIEGNEFWNHTFSKENGGEPVRLGNSDVSGCNFNTIVRKNTFHDLRSDVETISIKSCGNTIEDNDFENNQSMITIRHGGYNKIINNRFVGKGGIRVLGAGNEVKNNYFKNNQDDRWIPITIEYGNTERDPNFTADNKPIGKEGKSHAMYAQVNGGEITDNKFENCKHSVKTVDKGRKFGPVNNKAENNNVVQPGEQIPPTEPAEPADPEEEKPDVTPQDVIVRMEDMINLLQRIIAALKAKGIEVQ